MHRAQIKELQTSQGALTGQLSECQQHNKNLLAKIDELKRKWNSARTRAVFWRNKFEATREGAPQTSGPCVCLLRIRELLDIQDAAVHIAQNLVEYAVIVKALSKSENLKHCCLSTSHHTALGWMQLHEPLAWKRSTRVRPARCITLQLEVFVF